MLPSTNGQQGISVPFPQFTGVQQAHSVKQGLSTTGLSDEADCSPTEAERRRLQLSTTRVPQGQKGSEVPVSSAVFKGNPLRSNKSALGEAL